LSRKAAHMGDNAVPHARGGSRRACQRCDAELRRGQRGGLCAPCSRRPSSSGPLLEAEFFTREPIRRALASYDFGYVFRAVRRAAELTQQQLGDLLDLDQDRISRIERGERQLRDIALVARVASQLGISPQLLGFDPNAVTVERASTSKTREVDGVLRRDFSWAAAGTLLELSVDTLDLDRLAALLPASPATTTTTTAARIGAADVEAIEQATAVLRRWDYSRGSGLCRPVAVAQLRSVLPLLGAASTTDVRERLLVATADLGTAAAWASYDAGYHDDARRLFMLALSVAQQGAHPRVAELTACLLVGMANQALYLRQPREALSLVQLGYATAASRSQHLPASTASYLASFQAWGCAALGDGRACDRALGQSAEHFTHADPNTAPRGPCTSPPRSSPPDTATPTTPWP